MIVQVQIYVRQHSRSTYSFGCIVICPFSLQLPSSHHSALNQRRIQRGESALLGVWSSIAVRKKNTGIYSYWTDFQCLHSYRVVLPVLITSIHTDVHAINWDHYVCSVLSLRRELILAGLPASLLRNNGTCRNDTSCLKSFNVATTLLYIKIIGKEVH